MDSLLSQSNPDARSVGLVERQYFTFAEREPMALESGETLGPVTLAYETYGRLNADRSNVILILHALSVDLFFPTGPVLAGRREASGSFSRGREIREAEHKLQAGRESAAGTALAGAGAALRRAAQPDDDSAGLRAAEGFAHAVLRARRGCRQTNRCGSHNQTVTTSSLPLDSAKPE
jgi:hypothetical protein